MPIWRDGTYHAMSEYVGESTKNEVKMPINKITWKKFESFLRKKIKEAKNNLEVSYQIEFPSAMFLGGELSQDVAEETARILKKLGIKGAEILGWNRGDYGDHPPSISIHPSCTSFYIKCIIYNESGR